jgi:hypothetical protein
MKSAPQRPQTRRSFVAAGASWLAAASLGCSPGRSPAEPLTILVIGNSLVYTGNMPAVFDALSEANGRSTHSDMLVRGGARLADFATDGSAATVLDRKRYAVVVLQERGGDLIGGFGEDARHASIEAAGHLVKEAARRGAKPILLGSYQQPAEVSQALLNAEEAVARRWSIAHVRVSAAFRIGLATAPERAWLDADGMHPGADLTLLQAVLLYHALFGEWPKAGALDIVAPIYPRGAAFDPPRLAHETPALPAWARRRTYDRASVEAVIAVARRDDGQPTATALISPSSSVRD